jgi:nicotinamidase-related amidase
MLKTFLATSALCAVLALATLPAPAATIIDDWSKVTVPPAPALQAVKIDPSTTALLTLDFVKQTCGGPRCIAVLPAAGKLVQAARTNKVLVIYSTIPGGTMADTNPAVAPLPGDPSVQSGPDKFLGTDLQQILTQKGIKTVIVTGVSANGAVLYTASHAALLGYNVIVPVDVIAAENPYAEQYVVWNFTSAPLVAPKVKLTSSDA